MSTYLIGSDLPDHPYQQALRLAKQRKAKPMAERITATEALGYDPDDDPEAFERVVLDSVVPACCSEGCEVEPDGTCPHGHPSVLLELEIL